MADPWQAITSWLSKTPVASAAERAALLGLPGAPVPQRRASLRRAPILAMAGGPRNQHRPPLVADLTSLWAGPLCGDLLARTGTRVVKVESATRPDGARHGPAAFYKRLNGLKDSCVLDFSDPAGRAQLRELAEHADVVLEASRPRALQALGLDADALVAQGRIWLSITAYGRDGDNAMRVGFGDDIAAGAGLIAWDHRGPHPVGDALADPIAGVVAAAAVIKALEYPRGLLLDLSMHDLAAFTAALPACANERILWLASASNCMPAGTETALITASKSAPTSAIRLLGQGQDRS